MAERMPYKQAKANEPDRQIYLNEFFERNPNNNISALVYNLDKKPCFDRITELQSAGVVDVDLAEVLRKVMEHSTQLASMIVLSDTIGNGEKTPVFVNSRAFDLADEVEFEYNMVDHEYFHAMDIRCGIQLPGITISYKNAGRIQPETHEAVLETRALLNQLQRGVEKGLQDTVAFMNAVRGFFKYHHVLEGVEAENNFERLVIHTQISSYKEIMQELEKRNRDE